MIDFRYENSRDTRIRTSSYILPVLIPSSRTNFYSIDSKGIERVLE